MTEEINNQEAQSSYRSIFKATSLFGGVQVYQILIQVIKSKFIALLLGPFGVGVIGLYQTALDLIKQLTSFGLAQSAVRDVSEANGNNNQKRINETVSALRKLVWITGLLGTVVVAAFSPVLSRLTFGSDDYIVPFIILSITLLIDQLCAGQKVVLQGLRRLKDLAKASAYGVTLGLFVSVPLYYWLGIKGIIPTLLLNSATMFFLSWYFSRKIKIEHVHLSVKETLHSGSVMLKMGLAMSFSAIVTALTAYILKGCIRGWGGTEQVGLYQAGFTIMTAYVGLVFNSMSTDFYPRLSSVNTDNNKCREVVNQQGEIASLLLTPLLVACVIFMPYIVRLLYSEAFLPANDFILYSTLGMMFKLGSWAVAMQFVAKGEAKLFVINELAGGTYGTILYLIGYKLGGMAGLGIASTILNIVYFAQVYIIARIRYGFSFSSSFLRLFGIQFTLLAFVFVCLLFGRNVFFYIVGLIVFTSSGGFSIKELNNRMNIISLVRNRFSKK